MAAIGGGPCKLLFMCRESFGEGEHIENEQEWGVGGWGPKRMSLDGNERCRVDGGQLVMRIPQTHGLGGGGYVFVGLKHFSA